MRYLAARNPNHSTAVTLVTMRTKLDCLTCITAMLLGITYEEVQRAFGGNLDTSKDRKEEEERLARAFEMLLQSHNRGALYLEDIPPITEGRRYWVAVRIDDINNPLSEEMTHSIAIDEFGRVFDPNPEYGEFISLAAWNAAMTLPHKIEFATEIFEYCL